jgi:hypothetical protein
LRRSSIVLNFNISSGATTRQSTPSPKLGLAVKIPLRVCSCRTSPSHPSGLMKKGQQWRRGPHREKVVWHYLQKSTRGPWLGQPIRPECLGQKKRSSPSHPTLTQTNGDQSPSTSSSGRYQMMKPRPGAWRTRPRGTSSMTMICITAAPQVSSSGAFPLKKVRHYFSTFMKEYVGITLRQGAWSEWPYDKVFIGQRPPTMRLRS